MISGAFLELPGVVRENRLTLLLPGFFILLAVGMVHGLVPFSDRARQLWKYNDLMFPLLFIPLFLDAGVRERGLWAFGSSMALTLVLSLCIAAGLVPPNYWLHGTQASAIVFKHDVTHNVLMAFAAFLFAGVAVRQRVPWRRYALGVLAICAVVDVFMLVRGRTGQIVLSALILLWSERRFGIRGLLVGVATVSALVALSYSVSPVFQKRVHKTVMELERAQVEPVAPISSSVGTRAEWYRNTANLILAHPVAGVGTGSFARAYAELVTEPTAVKPAHPHNQYLLAAAELGVAGAGLLLALFATLWWKIRQTGEHLYGELGQGVVIVLAIGCVFNSFLVDHTEGLFFAWVISLALATKDHGLIGTGC
jgi:O-antigen ligase